MTNDIVDDKDAEIERILYMRGAEHVGFIVKRDGVNHMLIFVNEKFYNHSYYFDDDNVVTGDLVMVYISYNYDVINDVKLI